MILQLFGGGVRNTEFNAPENFVVFECVNRLLEKGYRPEHIELEKEWHLGHDSKGGRADICITDESGAMLLIVECKTWGREYEKALNDTYTDGAQLFSYWQQEQSTKWLEIYTSTIEATGKAIYQAKTINCSDDENILLLAKKDKSIKLYRDANTTAERFEAWEETYSKEIHEDLIFSTDSVAYRIGIKPLRKKDLQDFSPNDKIVNKFEEILRHNNVSDKENAFNRLVALFICKLVDESTKEINDVVEFQYRPGTDSYETLQDRLQRLHRDGMEKFMGEEIYYVSAGYAERLFSNYTGSGRKNAIADLKRTIRILKFYSNNDFAFKDVHNEELFYQNGKILVEMVQLFEKYRIVYPSKHQFLGDLFEQLLNKGFKQNEGQFFTPMPITRFIWDSLPIRNIIKSERGDVYPKIIDYACGAGHFLTEAVETVNHIVETENNNSWTRDHIYGIEKDYRLARVAKISLFMNGAGEGNIIFGDGLENTPERGIKNGTFDILVANPPYSVKDFKQHLKLKHNSFSLLERIGLNSGEIETLFVERIGQLLKPKGIAAVILPSSILSNDSSSYVGARELILKHFYIRAIVALGSKTFGATGTNTVILFLEKFNEPPKKTDLTSDSVDAIMNGQDLTNWKDQDVLTEYVRQINVDETTYVSFCSNSLSLDELANNEYFRMYVTAFSDSAEAKNLTRTKKFKNQTEIEQKLAYLDRLYSYAHEIEANKLFYFSLVYQQTTLIIKAPADNKGQKDFLGYDWSNRKGNEGIQISAPGGKMYDDSNKEAKGTLAHAIRESFEGKISSFSEEHKAFGSVVRTKNMLDFSRCTFNKAIQINVNSVIKNTSRYSALKLHECVDITGGLWTGTKEPLTKVRVIRNTNFTKESELNLSDVIEIYVEQSQLDSRRLQRGDIILEKSGGSQTQAVGRVVYFSTDENEVYSFSNFTARLRLVRTDLDSKYLYLLLKEYYLSGKTFGYQNGMGGLKNLDMKRYKDIPIPIPPITIQQKIIDECNKIEEQYHSTRMSIKEYQDKIEELFAQLDVISNQNRERMEDLVGGGKLKLADRDKFDVFIGKRVLNKQLSSKAQFPVISANVREPFGYIAHLLITDFSTPSVLWGIDGDWMTSYFPENEKFYPTDHCGVLRCKTDDVNPRYLTHILEREGAKIGFSRAYRASIDRIKGISFFVADRKTQDEIVNQIKTIEAKITRLEADLRELNGKPAEILRRYLN